ncbi:uncharacterized protein BYT42DRAFT_487417 [Radiomyces spectabilis]|uniref:uncharacterized protein n=1 Tax=Radiomyces spectabilis TaxID=64574 RepID=UPI0022205FE1|nr:uncharacterized protein BYT42DRAFT_487417 [Radiomyces spectabilis]KAI8393341.1 hypothetical protein BYT42DRAFT_487417 [Radiomyces spectabilis]
MVFFLPYFWITVASFHQINGGTHPHPGATSSHGSDKSRSSHSAASPAVKHTGHGLRKAVSSSNLPQHRVKRSLHTSDYLAAAIELNSSPNVAPAPAAGMYWSRAITYGRGPSRPLRAHTANLIGEQLYVFGGCDIKSCFNSLYILDMDTLTWSKPRVSGQIPPPCRAHSCTVVDKDLASGKRSTHLYVFGGGDGPNYFNDLYILNIGMYETTKPLSVAEAFETVFISHYSTISVDTLTWSKPPMEGTIPSPRRAHATCLWNDKIIVVGGGDGARALADVHALDISDPAHLRWTQLKPSGTPPIARGYHTSNLVKDKLIVYGGSDGHECFSDVHILDLVDNRWIHVDIDRAVPRLAHTATQVGSYIFVIGGHDGSRYSNDVLLLNLVTMSWESRKIYGGAPTPRGYHTTVLHDCRLYLLGGFDGRNVFEDVYVLELSACAYLPQITNFEVDA